MTSKPIWGAGSRPPPVMRWASLFLMLAPALAGQEPQLVWRGEVDGVVLLRVQKNRVAVEESEGRLAGRPTFRFARPLPERRQFARLEVLQGRGSARIVEQPAAHNNYSLVVSIEDPQPGSAPYSLAFHWEEAEGAAKLRILNARRRETLAWSGRAEGEVVVSCRAESCEAETTGGVAVRGGRARFTKPLPNRETAVVMLASSGRGDVRLLEQPSEANRHTARVLISDPHAGSSAYSFKLAWLEPKDEPPRPARPGMFWFGRVEESARVTVHGRAAAATGTATATRAEFERNLAQAVAVSLWKLRGRGEVRIVEQPSKANGWTLVFEVADAAPGADDYEVEVRW
jgi:hypothetical protein